MLRHLCPIRLALLQTYYTFQPIKWNIEIYYILIKLNDYTFSSHRYTIASPSSISLSDPAQLTGWGE
jgi:hypothetical protein